MKLIATVFLGLVLFCQCVLSHNPSCHKNVVYYYGKGKSQDNPQSLQGYCSENHADMFIISSFLASERGKPALNLKDGVHDAVSYPHSDLKHYPSLEEGIKHCQSMGKKVLLSIEDDFSRIKGDTEEFARLLWQLFGPNVTADNRPFGTAVVDGFHLSAKHYNYNQRNLPSMSSKSIRFVQSTISTRNRTPRPWVSSVRIISVSVPQHTDADNKKPTINLLWYGICQRLRPNMPIHTRSMGRIPPNWPKQRSRHIPRPLLHQHQDKPWVCYRRTPVKHPHRSVLRNSCIWRLLQLCQKS